MASVTLAQTFLTMKKYVLCWAGHMEPHFFESWECKANITQAKLFSEPDFGRWISKKTKLQCKITSVTLAQALLTREKSDPFAGLATWSGISLRDVNAKQAKHKPFFSEPDFGKCNS